MLNKINSKDASFGGRVQVIEDFEATLKVHPSREGKLNGVLYKQAGNSMPVPILEAIFKQLLNIT